MKESFMSYKTFIDIGIPLGAAFFGAIIGGVFALIAGVQAHRNNLKFDRIQKQQHINGVLLAISNELNILGEFYSTQSGASLDSLKEGENYTTYFSLRQQYFIVYPNNTDVVGQIQDPSLVKAIVYTYNVGNFLIESFLINNWYIDKWKDSQRADGTVTWDVAARLDRNHLKHTVILKEVHKRLRTETALLLQMINTYLITHPTE